MLWKLHKMSGLDCDQQEELRGFYQCGLHTSISSSMYKSIILTIIDRYQEDCYANVVKHLCNYNSPDIIDYIAEMIALMGGLNIVNYDGLAYAIVAVIDNEDEINAMKILERLCNEVVEPEPLKSYELVNNIRAVLASECESKYQNIRAPVEEYKFYFRI